MGYRLDADKASYLTKMGLKHYSTLISKLIENYTETWIDINLDIYLDIQRKGEEISNPLKRC